VARAAQRDYLIERCKWAAAALFAPPGAAPARDPEPAARQLRTWSMAGLERLFADLFQVGGWGRRGAWGGGVRLVSPQHNVRCGLSWWKKAIG
jgi:hypothetical protein